MRDLLVFLTGGLLRRIVPRCARRWRRSARAEPECCDTVPPTKGGKHEAPADVHVAVDNLDRSIGFYSTLFAAKPSVLKDDYAKWMLDDPKVNFAISARGRSGGIDHLGIQVESDDELRELAGRLQDAGEKTHDEEAVTCCYARGNKSWVNDPSGVRWETFSFTLRRRLRPTARTRGKSAGCGLRARCVREDGLLRLMPCAAPPSPAGRDDRRVRHTDPVARPGVPGRGRAARDRGAYGGRVRRDGDVADQEIRLAIRAWARSIFGVWPPCPYRWRRCRRCARRRTIPSFILGAIAFALGAVGRTKLRDAGGIFGSMPAEWVSPTS